MNIYAAYRGDEFIDLGTIKQLASKFRVKEDTIRYYTSKAYRRKIAARKNAKDYLLVIKVED